MVDECTDVATKEQMSICIRFVDESSCEIQVREGFTDLQVADAKSITQAIVQYLEDSGLDLTYLIGQGYDGVTVMSGKVSGVCTQIQQLQPHALYHHCQGHALNLVVASSCKRVP